MLPEEQCETLINNKSTCCPSMFLFDCSYKIVSVRMVKTTSGDITVDELGNCLRERSCMRLSKISVNTLVTC